MIRTVNSAFDKFMIDIVNLDKDIVSKARSSLQNLLEKIFKTLIMMTSFIYGKILIYNMVHLREKLSAEN